MLKPFLTKVDIFFRAYTKYKIPASNGLARTLAMRDNNAMNVAIIGASDEAASIISSLKNHLSANIVGFCDPDLNSASTSIAEELDIPLFERIEQLSAIGDVDLIIDMSDGKLAVDSVDSLKRIEVISGASARFVKELLAAQRCREEDLTSIIDAGFDLASKKDSQSIFRSILENALKITGSKTGTLIIFNERTETCRLAEVIGYSGKSGGLTWELQPGGITEQLLDLQEPMFIQDINQEPLFDNPVMNEGTVSVLASALKEADEVIGLLFVGDFKPRQFSKRDISLFSCFALQASLALQKALLMEKNEELVVIDSLTGIYNKNHFFASLDMEIKRARRYGGNFSLLLIDLDNLDYINDYLGRSKGDLALKKVAEILRLCLRQTDYSARLGDDEFAVILPNTNSPQATIVANRIRRQINDISIKSEIDDKSIKLTASIGIAEFPCLGNDCDDLMNAASTALYICKQRGRNLVCCFEDTGGLSNAESAKS